MPLGFLPVAAAFAVAAVLAARFDLRSRFSDLAKTRLALRQFVGDRHSIGNERHADTRACNERDDLGGAYILDKLLDKGLAGQAEFVDAALDGRHSPLEIEPIDQEFLDLTT